MPPVSLAEHHKKCQFSGRSRYVRFKIAIGIAIENRCQTNVSRADFDPDTDPDSDFEFGWNPKVEL